MSTDTSHDPRPPSKGSSWTNAVVAFLAGVLLTGVIWFLLADPAGEPPVDESTTTTATTTPPDEPDPTTPPYAEEQPGTWDVVNVEAGSTLDVRALPGAEEEIVGTLPFDSVGLESSGRIAISDGVLWREIEGPGTTTGWVDASHLAPATAAEPETDLGIPDEALVMAEQIRMAAEAEDMETLASLALEGEFTASFGQDVTSQAELVALWDEIGRDEVLAAITGLLSLPDWYETEARDSEGDVTAIFVTPRFMHESSNAENRRLLEEALGAEYVESAVFDGQYLGWRLGITAEGDWQFFVSGD